MIKPTINCVKKLVFYGQFLKVRTVSIDISISLENNY